MMMCSCEQNSVKGCQNLVAQQHQRASTIRLCRRMVVKLCGFYAIMNERRTPELSLLSVSLFSTLAFGICWGRGEVTFCWGFA